VAAIDAACAADLIGRSAIIREDRRAHAREHSLEMQLPFLQRVVPAARIVPLLMGYQTAGTAQTLGEALASALRGRRALLVASTDLSHYHDRATAVRLDGVVMDCVSNFDADALQSALTAEPAHACGGGPTVAVMRAAKLLGATDSALLAYGDSGDISGDTSAVVGYMAAAFGQFTKRESLEVVRQRALEG
jgi:MEMO1 family protein